MNDLRGGSKADDKLVLVRYFSRKSSITQDDDLEYIEYTRWPCGGLITLRVALVILNTQCVTIIFNMAFQILKTIIAGSVDLKT